MTPQDHTTQPTVRQDLQDLENELRAVMAARRELAPEHEEQLAEAFLQRLEQHIDQRLGSRKSARADNVNPVGILAVALIFAIPLSAIAGSAAGFAGLALVWAAITAVVWFVTHQ